MKAKYDKIKWHFNSKWLKAWKEGKTGFPIVDAGMRELKTTGYMHNRARLITASFLVKTLLISWEHGEKYFATQLTDYDPASNNGNWQWIASTGADSQPYFRIFNPWEQAKHYDPNAEYIKKWIPELRDISVKDILNWESVYDDDEYKKITYPKPIVDYTKQKEIALKMYGAVFS
jgi:deoxyribodipyrimidine photo-lyase